MNCTLKLAAGLALLSVALSACGGGGGGGGGSMAPAPAAKFETQFGGAFATAYQASPNSEPKDVAAGDVIPVNATAEPVALPGT